MNKIEMMKACLDGEVCSDEEGEVKYGFINGVFSAFEIDEDEYWSPLDFNTINSQYRTFQIHTAPKREFDIKPFEQVLVRNGDKCWDAGHFSCIDDDKDFGKLFMTTYHGYEQIALYAGNEDKLNTTDDIADKWTKEDIK